MQGKSENGCGSQEIHDGSRLRVPSCRGREWERLVYCLKRGCDNPGQVQNEGPRGCEMPKEHKEQRQGHQRKGEILVP